MDTQTRNTIEDYLMSFELEQEKVTAHMNHARTTAKIVAFWFVVMLFIVSSEGKSIPELVIVYGGATYSGYLLYRFRKNRIPSYDLANHFLFAILTSEDTETRDRAIENLVEMDDLILLDIDNHEVLRVARKLRDNPGYRDKIVDSELAPIVLRQIQSQEGVMEFPADMKLDDELFERCYPVYEQGHYETAIQNALKVFETRLRTKTRTSGYGRSLAKNAFTQGHLSWDKGSDGNDPARFLFEGAMGVFRNPPAHKFTDPSKQRAYTVIFFANELLNMIEEADDLPSEE